ncbi:agamous-like MADS-box protein AGL61 [Salvia miltiorrhiza]|uniref:agamous-like MADS-box protein AGL61 n=1 Tax=Salvia miltiorrhiza TaxID=226208 RepID=UPI0025AB816E|nr:agamous-like MADS-box protein AGL61 [Salvia miltiorrhiza]
MGRRRIEITLIPDKSKRHTTFTKRRNGLTKIAYEFCRKFDSTAVLLIFSSSQNCYAFGHPEIDSVLNRYEVDSSSAEAGTSAAEERAVTEMERRIGNAVESGRWEEAVRGLGLDAFDQLTAELENIRRQVAAFQTKFAAAPEEETQDPGRS